MICPDNIDYSLHGDHSVDPVDLVLGHLGERVIPSLSLEVVDIVALIVALLDRECGRGGFISDLVEQDIMLSRYSRKQRKEHLGDALEQILHVENEQRAADLSTVFVKFVRHGLIVLIVEICRRMVDTGEHYERAMAAIALVFRRVAGNGGRACKHCEAQDKAYRPFETFFHFGTLSLKI